MTSEITRREWLAGGTLLAGSLIASNIAKAQTVMEPNLNPTPNNAIRAGSNENVYGPSLKAQEAMNKAMKTAHLYDFRSQFVLKKVISEIENIPEDHIAMANGSSPFLEKAGYVSRIQDGTVLAPYPTYNTLSSTARTLGGKVIDVPVDENMSVDLEAMRTAMTDEVKMIYICNPNNPIPTIIEKKALREFCIEMSKRAIIVIDEAYYEYVDNPDFSSMVDLVTEHKNIIVARTASKIHAFAGIRVGFAFAHPETLLLIAGRFNLSMGNVAMQGAIVSYQDTEYQNFIKQKNKESMAILYELFEDLNLPYIKSNTNFVFFKAGRPSKEIATELRKHGIMSGREFKPFTDWVRWSTVKPQEMQYVADTYKKLYG